MALTPGEFDASTLNPETVRFAGAASLYWAMADVDRDGDLDLLLEFSPQELEIDKSSTEATLTGAACDGTPIYGTDTVKVVGTFTSPILEPVP